jgi:drug/metabolite transporter (DMT)-like permease
MKWAYALELKPLTISGIRFGLAALILMPLWIFRTKRGSKASALAENARISKIPLWVPMALGFAGYTVTVGGQNIGLYFLEAHQVTLVLAVNNTIRSLIWSYILLREKPSALQGLALFVALLGIALYYYLWRFSQEYAVGILPLLVAGIGYGL